MAVDTAPTGCSEPLDSLLLRTIYEKLASAFTEEVAVLYRQRVEEISPNIRYCAYNIGEYCWFTSTLAQPAWPAGGGAPAGAGLVPG